MIKTFDQYSEAVADHAHYPDCGKHTKDAVAYCVIGAAGETGEIADEIKKALRDDKFGYQERCLTPERRHSVLLEIGDALWYLDRLAAELGSSLGECAAMNMDKLDERRLQEAADGNERAAAIWRIRCARRRRAGQAIPKMPAPLEPDDEVNPFELDSVE